MNSLILSLKEYINVIKTVVQWYIYHLMFCCDSIITSEQNISQPIYNNQVFFYVSESHVLIILVLVGLGYWCLYYFVGM